MNMLKSLALAFSCFTRLPVPKVDWNRRNLRFMLAWLPVVGIAVGLLTAIWWLIAEAAGFGSALKAAGVALVPLAVTGGFHLDGFSDVVDAQSSNAEPEHKREILKDPHVGSFAVIGVVAYLLAYFGLATELPQGGRVAILLVCLHVMSRCGSGFASTVFGGSGEQGMLESFRESSDETVTMGMCVGFFVVAGVCAIVVAPVCGCVMVVAEVLLVVWLRVFARRNFGGMSGDVAGFFLQVCELVLLACIVVVAKAVGL